MDLFAAWVAFPALLAVLCLGCGLLVERLLGAGIPRALLPATGLALIVVAGSFLALADATAELIVPVTVALALAGLVAGRRSLRLSSSWAAATALAVFAVYAAPIVLSGEATFAGYIRLDDTATWMALSDRVLEHGRDLDGLAPSTYEATLAFNLGDGYPIGVFLPLGVGAALTGVDVAWLIAPYMALLAALLALALWTLARPLVVSAPIRAAIAFAGAQPALLYGYYLWGGIKEVAAAALIATGAALLARALAGGLAIRPLLAAALPAAALAGVLSAAGLVWLAPAAALVAALGLRSLGPRAVAIRLAGLLAATAALALPVAIAGGLLPPTSAPLTDAGASGNLIGPLAPAQAAGIWPAGDFRLDPVAALPTELLIAAALLAAAGGLAAAVRRRAWGVVGFVGGGLAAALAIWLAGSPWVDAKALATVSPAIPFAAGIGLALLAARGAALAASFAAVALLAGLGWSNALAYRDVNLAPRAQLGELETIGERIAGEGPALLTEYQPYGARHFLRDADPEAVSELRRRRVALAAGGIVPKGESADTDRLEPAALAPYRTLVVRRSPAQSRPPAAYGLDWSGEYYEVWQRRASTPGARARIGLGRGPQPVAVPACGRVRALAAGAPAGARLVAAARPRTLVAGLAAARYPDAWSTAAHRSTPVPAGEGKIVVEVEVPRSGQYELWLAGSVRPRVEVEVDGEPLAELRHRLNNDGQYVALGAAPLARGRHTISIGFAGADLSPGSGGAAAAVGPLVLARDAPADARLVAVPLDAAERLCGRAWDWIELDG